MSQCAPCPVRSMCCETQDISKAGDFCFCTGLWKKHLDLERQRRWGPFSIIQIYPSSVSLSLSLNPSTETLPPSPLPPPRQLVMMWSRRQISPLCSSCPYPLCCTGPHAWGWPSLEGLGSLGAEPAETTFSLGGGEEGGESSLVNASCACHEITYVSAITLPPGRLTAPFIC